MKIQITLDQKSIKNAIKILEEQQKILTDIAIPEFLADSAEWIRKRANEIVHSSDIGSAVIKKIVSSWKTNEISHSQIVLYNDYWKAAYVEFGVGIIGKESSHPDANQANWEYNIKTLAKDDQGGWKFSVDRKSELDIPQSAIIDTVKIDNKTAIYTKGAQGVWFLFNAVEDFKMKKARQFWEQIKIKYWS